MNPQKSERIAVWLRRLSISAYTLAYIYLPFCFYMDIAEELLICGFIILTAIGCWSIVASSQLYKLQLTSEDLEELYKFIDDIDKNKD